MGHDTSVYQNNIKVKIVTINGVNRWNPLNATQDIQQCCLDLRNSTRKAIQLLSSRPYCDQCSWNGQQPLTVFDVKFTRLYGSVYPKF